MTSEKQSDMVVFAQGLFLGLAYQRMGLLGGVLARWSRCFFPSNAFMALARSFNMFYCMLQDGIN